MKKFSAIAGVRVHAMQDRDFSALEDVSGCRFDRWARKRIEAAVFKFMLERGREQEGITQARILEHLGRVERHARELHSLLVWSAESANHDLHHLLLVAANFIDSDTPGEPVPEGLDGFGAFADPDREFLDRLLQIASTCTAHINALKGSSTGRPRDSSFDELILKLHPIWIRAGGQGKGAYYDSAVGKYLDPGWSEGAAGPFFSLCMEALVLAGETGVSPDGMRKRIDRLIPNRK